MFAVVLHMLPPDLIALVLCPTVTNLDYLLQKFEDIVRKFA